MEQFDLPIYTLSFTTNVHPPFERFSAEMSPPTIVRIRFTSASPRPLPSSLRVVSA